MNEASGTVTVCARLNTGALERNISVTMSTIDGTASSNGNYIIRCSIRVDSIHSDKALYILPQECLMISFCSQFS